MFFFFFIELSPHINCCIYGQDAELLLTLKNINQEHFPQKWKKNRIDEQLISWKRLFVSLSNRDKQQ